MDTEENDSSEEHTGPFLHVRGTIARIQAELENSRNEKLLAFSLIPSADFVQSTEDGKCKVFAKDHNEQLFPVSTLQWHAENGKPTILFNVENPDHTLKCFLLEVKNSHNEVQVTAASDDDDDGNGFYMDYASIIDVL